MLLLLCEFDLACGILSHVRRKGSALMPVWTKPQVTDVTIECREDILADCWSESATSPISGCCGFLLACPGD